MTSSEDISIEELVEIISNYNSLELDDKATKKHLELLQDIVINSKKYNSNVDHLPFSEGNHIYDVAKNPCDLVEAFDLCYRVYSKDDVAYIDTKLFPLGLELDKFDEFSTHFIAKYKESNKICGYLRMIHDNPLGLQVEMGLDISDYRKKYKICEHSRLVIFPHGQPEVRGHLLRNLNVFAKKKGIQKILGETSTIMEKFYTPLGIVPMEPYRTWKLMDRKHWGSKKDFEIYGTIYHLDQEGDK